MKLVDKLETARKEYSDQWDKVLKDWNSLKLTDAAWLTYAANYLLFTGGTRWAIDPLSMSTRIAGIQKPDFANDLKNLEFVVLSHAHNDHLDLTLIDAIAHLPIKWIIPQHMLEKVLEKTHIDKLNIIVPENGKSLTIGSVTLTPFDSLHFHARGGIEETGYLVEFNNKRWLFPGDIRNYDSSKLPYFEKLDGIFAHLWLGKGHAKDKRPPCLEDFVKFYAALSPARLVITHLDEFGRAEDELWDDKHYMLVSKEIHAAAPSISVKMAKMGMKVVL
ncbi:MAG: MBL fold metallo-hydrolase [Anaerolineaceae bacterium]